MKLQVFIILVAAWMRTSHCGCKARYPQDCVWRPWRDGGCLKLSDGSFRRQEIRGKIEAKNGGNDCIGEKTRMTTIDCSPKNFVKTEIFKGIGVVRPSFVPRPPPPIAAKPVIQPVAPKPPQSSFEPEQSSNQPSPAPDKPEQSPNEEEEEEETDKNEDTLEKCEDTFTESSGVRLLSAKCDVMGRTVKTTQPTPQFDTPLRPRDVLFLVDESGSLNSEQFKMELDLINVIVGSFCEDREVGRFTTRVSLSTFSSYPVHHIDFDKYWDANDFTAAVKGIRKGNGQTCLVDALNSVRDLVFTVENGSRAEESRADGLIILITDGCFNCFPEKYLEGELDKQLELFREKGIYFMTFMIGESCVENFRLLFDGTACHQGVHIPKWSDLQDLIESMAMAQDQDNASKECIASVEKSDTC